jgi:hypothetical protein
MFEADEATQDGPRLAARTAGRKLEAAIGEVRANFGRFLLGATGIDEFGDRWHYSKADIRRAVEPYVFPNTGTMRRIQNAMKQDWKLAHPYKLAIDHDDAGFGSMPTGDGERNQDLDETFHPSSGNLIPSPDFEGYKDSVDQDGPSKVQRDFTPGGDSGRHAATDWDKKRVERAETMRGRTEGTPAEQEWQDEHDRLTGGGDDGKKEAAMLVADIYTDFAQSNGLRVASLDTLDHYASTGIADADYRLLESMIVRAAEEEAEEAAEDEDGEDEGACPCGEPDCDCDEEDDPDGGDDSESDDGGDYDFGGSGHDDDDHHETAEDTDGDGDHDDEDHHDGGEEYDFGGGGGDQTYTVPDQAPELDPQLLNEIPHDDPQGAAPVPPEVIDSLLGLPEGTIEQLLLEEVQQGGGDPGMSGPPVPGGAPQGGGDDFLGGVGDDADAGEDPRRVAARRRFARLHQAKDCNCWKGYKRVPGTKPCAEGSCEKCDSSRKEGRRRLRARASNGDPRAYARLRAEWERAERRASRSARRFWAAEGDQEQPGGGDPSGGGRPPQGDPPQGGDPAAMGMDPAAMGGGQPMVPPPGSQAVQFQQPPQQLENQPAEDALLDTANQAIMQMIDRETQEYQQIIDPLSQALQAIQFAQQVEQAEHPMDVTPPEGTVDASPSAALGGAQSMQQQAKRRRASKKVNALRNAARLIAGRYNLSHGGERMLLEAMGRRNYEHVREALQLLPPEHLQAPQHRAAVRHIGEMFAADNPRFNRDVWMRSVLGSAPGSRHPFDRPRLAGETLLQTPTMDAFEWDSDKPRVDDNNPMTDLPVMKGASASDAVSRFQRWTKWQQQQGLPVPGGDGGIHDFMQKTRNPGRAKIGDEASDILHRSMGLEPDAPRAPKAKPLKAVNPTLNKPKAPRAGRRTAAGFFLDGPRDEGDGRPDPSTLHCSRCGHTAPGADDRDDNLCPRCPQSVMDYRFYGHPTGRLVDDFHRNPDSNYGDALFEELKHRSDMDDDTDAARAVDRGPRESPHAWESDRSRHPSNQGPVDDYAPRNGELSLDDVANAYQGWDPDDNPGPDDPRIRGASRTASFFTRRVPGWKWDDHLNGYISKEARDFSCQCGQRVASPSYRTCGCGKVWNVYAIGDTHHLASDTADMYVAREIEVRPGVIMANRRMAAGHPEDEWPERFIHIGPRNRREQEAGEGQMEAPPGQSLGWICYACGGIHPPGYQCALHDSGMPPYYAPGGAKEVMDGFDVDPDEHLDPDDPRIRGAALFARLAAGGMSYEDAMAHIDEVLSQGEGHDLHHQPGVDARHQHHFDAQGHCAGCGSTIPNNWDDDDDMGMCPSCGEIMPKDDMTIIEGRRGGDLHGGGSLDYHCDDCADEIAGPVCTERGCGNRIYAEGHQPGCPAAEPGSLRGAALFARLAASGMSHDDIMKHIDEVLAEGEGHSLHHHPGVDALHESESPPPGECPDCGGDGCDWDTYPNHEGEADLCRTCDGTGDAAVEFEPHLREPRPGSIRAEAAWRRHLADWTKYDDDVDPVVEAYGKPKPASTRIPKQPRDWAKRTPAGTWQGPAIPRKRK